MTEDLRKIGLKRGLHQLNVKQLYNVLTYPAEMVLDSFNYEDGKFCPLAVGVGLDRTMTNPTHEKVFEELTKLGYSVYNTRGIKGTFYTTNRKEDLLLAAKEVFLEKIDEDLKKLDQITLGILKCDIKDLDYELLPEMYRFGLNLNFKQEILNLVQNNIKLILTTKYKSIIEEVNNITDALGKPIDPKIKSTIIGLKLFHITTLQSCEGHEDWGCHYPWVDVKKYNEIKLKKLIWDFRVASLSEPYMNMWDAHWNGFAIEENKEHIRLIGYHKNNLTACQTMFEAFGKWLIETFLAR